MRIGFYTNQLGLRGSDQFCFDLAHYSETLLGHTSVIITPEAPITYSRDVTEDSVARFHNRFQVVPANGLEQTACSLKLDAIIISKWGLNDGLVTIEVPCIVHAIFECRQPHGHVYASISDFMVRKCGARCPVLPFIAQLPSVQDLRAKLGIPPDALVFGRHGGYEQFDVEYVREAVRLSAAKHHQVYFLFLNTKPFMKDVANVKFLSGTACLEDRASFVHTADVMIHGRSDGETFGLACGEFSVANKPIITTTCGDLAHIDILGAQCLICTELGHVVEAIETCIQLGRSALKTERWDMYGKYTPQHVTEIFQGLIELAIQRKIQGMKSVV